MRKSCFSLFTLCGSLFQPRQVPIPPSQTNRGLKTMQGMKIEKPPNAADPLPADVDPFAPSTLLNFPGAIRPPVRTALSFSPLNRIRVTGVVHSLEYGSVNEVTVLQFLLSVTNANIPSDEPVEHPLTPHFTNKGQIRDKESFPVRVYGEELIQYVRSNIASGTIVAVTGSIRMNPQGDSLTRTKGAPVKYYPFISVAEEKGGLITVLSCMKEQQFDASANN